MPRFAAEEVLNNKNATIQEVHRCIASLSEEIGNLNCRSHADPQLAGDLRELVELEAKLEEKYNALSSNVQQNS